MRRTPPRPTTLSRRRLLGRSLAAGAGLAAVAAGCEPREPAATAPEVPEWLTRTPDGALDLSDLPYRQDDPTWGSELMWDRELVLRTATEVEGLSRAEAEALLFEYEDGNDIANEGCMLTCLAMVLRMLGAKITPAWTPSTLNAAAQSSYYYTRSGLSMITLYADLVSEVSEGAVQLHLKEEYLPGTPGWPKLRASSSALVRAYRSLPARKRSDFLVMLKTGTYDDTVASHYVLVHPDDDGTPDDDDVLLLDPAQPSDTPGPWRLTDSARLVTMDPEIAAAWAADGIEPTQLGGAWVFSRWRADRRGAAIDPLIHAWATQLLALGR